ncbi:MAG: hypothetical protein J3T61_00165 [Candidatus Brocadiales bacterium]|nr:hypothetical protein [Candidatus Bathyanammoxibius sp.]
MFESTYDMALLGRATNFTETELPPGYAQEYLNRFTNAAGGAEKRQGIVLLGNTLSGTPTLTGLHELVLKDGTDILMVSGAGAINSLSGSTWTQIHTVSSTDPLTSVQMGNRLIFTNGVDRPFFTEDGVVFRELKAIIEQGALTSGASTTSIRDDTIDNWVGDTNVVVNDIAFNIDASAFGVITAAVTASLTHSAIGTAATGAGVGSKDQASGDRYEVLDMVELNIIPTTGEDDNAATAGVGTSAGGVAVSAVSNWLTTDLRVGDFVRNTTRTAVARVQTIGTTIFTTNSVASQTSGDSLVFLKSAQPIATKHHVHYDRLYGIDERDRRKIRISGANDPQDMTEDAGTLDAISFAFGDLQPEGDSLLSMGSFQAAFIVGGKRNIYAFSGTNPIGSSADFTPVGLFPQGVVAKNGIISIGNDLTFVNNDGLQAFSQIDDFTSLGRANLSEAIRNDLRDELSNASDADIQLFHYRRRSWVVLKIKDRLHVYNYTPLVEFTRAQQRFDRQESGSWHLFTGKFARQNFYFIRQDGTLVCCGAGGRIFSFDQDTFDDDGENITTTYQTGHLTYEEPKKSVQVKALRYIKPIFEVGVDVNYTIRAEGGLDGQSTEIITVGVSSGADAVGSAVIGSFIIGGSKVQNQKFPLRVRGETVRLTFSNDNQLGPDILSRLTLYWTKHGKK